jgi:hypothetical protein
MSEVASQNGPSKDRAVLSPEVPAQRKADSSGELLPDRMFATALVGPSYSRGTKFLLLGMLTQMAMLAFSTRERWGTISWELWLFIALAMIPVISWSWYIFVGKTTLDHKGLRRQVPFNQLGYDVRWHEVAAVRYLKLPIGGRLIVKTSSPGPAKTFQAGNDVMREAFLRLEALYKPPKA